MSAGMVREGMSADDAEFAGTILTAMVSHGHAVSNALVESVERQRDEARALFTNLYDAIEKANETVDSLRVDIALSRFEFDREMLRRAEDPS